MLNLEGFFRPRKPSARDKEVATLRQLVDDYSDRIDQMADEASERQAELEQRRRESTDHYNHAVKACDHLNELLKILDRPGVYCRATLTEAERQTREAAREFLKRTTGA